MKILKKKFENSFKIGSNEVIPHNAKQEKNKPSVEELSTKYIQCIAQTPIKIFSKLIRNKYNIPHSYKVKISHFKHFNKTKFKLKLF